MPAQLSRRTTDYETMHETLRIRLTELTMLGRELTRAWLKHCSEEQPWVKRIDNGDVVLSTLKIADSKLWVVRLTSCGKRRWQPEKYSNGTLS